MDCELRDHGLTSKFALNHVEPCKNSVCCLTLIIDS